MAISYKQLVNNVEIYCSQVDKKYTLNCPPCLGKNWKFTLLKSELKFSSMVGEKNLLTRLKWLKLKLNCPPWWDKIVKFTLIK